MEEYVPVKLPRDLIQDMDKLVGTHGFRSRVEIAKEARWIRLLFYGTKIKIPFGTKIRGFPLSPNKIINF